MKVTFTDLIIYCMYIYYHGNRYYKKQMKKKIKISSYILILLKSMKGV